MIDLPRSAAGEDLRSRKAAMIGQTLTLKVIELDRRRNRLVLSERKALRATQKARLEQLRVGEFLTGTVVNLVSFGASVDIGGVDGLVHISKLDRRYVDKPSDVVSVGDEVTVRVDAVDVERQRINLNRAVMLPIPGTRSMNIARSATLSPARLSRSLTMASSWPCPTIWRGCCTSARWQAAMSKRRRRWRAREIACWCASSKSTRHSRDQPQPGRGNRRRAEGLA